MSNILISYPFIIWSIINLLAGIWEIYAYQNRDKIKLIKPTIWERMLLGEITLSNFWLEAWGEYCKVDARYITPPHTYVWYFELLNAGIAVFFILAILIKSFTLIKLLLEIAIINCIAYFVSLAITMYYNSKLQSKLKTQYARLWQYPVYYAISAIWLIIPIWLYSKLLQS